MRQPRQGTAIGLTHKISKFRLKLKIVGGFRPFFRFCTPSPRGIRRENFAGCLLMFNFALKMGAIKFSYKIARSILFSAVALVAVVFVALYVTLSAPSFQGKLKDIAEKEVSELIGSRVEIKSVSIMPFNEAKVSGLKVYTPDNQLCLYVDDVAAGINLWKLLSENKIELTYAEVIGLDARLWQRAEGEPLNIDFIIKAFQPKEKNKPPTMFSLKLHNVVIRRGHLSFDKLWKPRLSDRSRIDMDHLHVNDIKADLYLPQLKNDDFIVDLRRLSLNVDSLFYLDRLALKSHITKNFLSVSGLDIKLGGTEITPSDITLNYDGFGDIVNSLKRTRHSLVIVDNPVDLSDFAGFVPALAEFGGEYRLSLNAEGSGDNIDVRNLSVKSRDILLELGASLDAPLERGRQSVDVESLHLHADAAHVAHVLSRFDRIPAKVMASVASLGDIDIDLSGNGSLAERSAEADVVVSTGAGRVIVEADGRFPGKSADIAGMVTAEEVNLGAILGRKDLGRVNMTADGSVSVAGKDIEGEGFVNVSSLEYAGRMITDITVEGSKQGNTVQAAFSIADEIAEAAGNAALLIDGKESELNAEIDVRKFIPSLLGKMTRYDGYAFEGHIKTGLKGNRPENITGSLLAENLGFSKPGHPSLGIGRLSAAAVELADGRRHYDIKSDILEFSADGVINLSTMPAEVKGMIAECMPVLVSAGGGFSEGGNSDFDLSLRINPSDMFADFFRLPVRPLVPVVVNGRLNTSDGVARLELQAPFLRQGSNKLVQATSLSLSLDAAATAVALNASTVMPAKKGDIRLDLAVDGRNEDFSTVLDMNSVSGPDFNGSVAFDVAVTRRPDLVKPEVDLDIRQSSLNIGKAEWNIDKGHVSYANGAIDINTIKAWHDDQFVEIEGTASASTLDSVSVRLRDFDLGYLFETLNINYVTFGGTATGEIMGCGLLSREPVAATKFLDVRQLSYNGGVLGDAKLKAGWDNAAKKVSIFADIAEAGKRAATVDGGIWVTRDSLSFDINTDKVDIAFLKPFMAAFTSDVGGRASGNVKLFGTFSDIDLTGRVFADTIYMKVDYTNVYYSGSDSVFMDSGRIRIPDFRLYDRNGNSALLNGEVRHRYFHDPSFTFRLSDARNLLCYDTNPKMNPDWYGTVYGTGGGFLRGFPGVVSLDIDMTTTRNTDFTFVLNDTQAAGDYRFLTFSDRKAERLAAERKDSVPDFVSMFKKKVAEQDTRPSVFELGIRATVTPESRLNIVMDPVAGDRIIARGAGAFQIDYDTESDAMTMFGKYVLDEGNYNFSLQDIILKDFTIRPGSSISFNGDPLRAHLDITAAYRVNTNLSDLDKSFSTDKDLNRTNVPVDALLNVSGEMTSPDITFDIELPTLTSDVTRKVKSIISTDDMMSRQIIYLLALNRFYTPEYMGGGGNGGELASVASSTLSSQLQNMIGQLTDKFTLAPSFRSDRGDFSDIEVDLALSSRLLDNRLLINGNFGYRDRSTSSTTFVGDFDIEYLLSRNGNLRLKAYNHFNDQNYYIRSSLTTQGIGVVYRHDFETPFSFLRRRKKKKTEDTPAPPADTVTPLPSKRE